MNAMACAPTESPDAASNSTARIRMLNDRLRTTFTSGRIMLTRGVQTLTEAERAELLNLVRSFDDFDRGNDHHGEHDFGSVEVAGTRYFWKIDYYDRSLTYGSPDPANDAVTTRVMTIMRADEY